LNNFTSQKIEQGLILTMKTRNNTEKKENIRNCFLEENLTKIALKIKSKNLVLKKTINQHSQMKMKSKI
jgi:hypothetical protein